MTHGGSCGDDSAAVLARSAQGRVSIAHVLVVCIGNICRSPMAEGLLRQALPDARVGSAGLAAVTGMPADPLAVQLLAARGVDIGAHRARQFDGALAQEADLILVMDLQQKHQVQRLYPQVSGRVFRLGERSGFDIPDPYLQSRSAFEDALRQIVRGVDEWAPHIRAVRHIAF